jgi:hypothetical protein
LAKSRKSEGLVRRSGWIRRTVGMRDDGWERRDDDAREEEEEEEELASDSEALSTLSPEVPGTVTSRTLDRRRCSWWLYSFCDEGV